ncbi:MAG: multidrug efflux SMR transporter [Arthrobacter sp.]|jgi:small multidrug resistance pump
MKKWFYLACATVLEVSASLSLQAAVTTPAWYLAVVVGYVGSFALLSLVLRHGMPLGVAYGVWAATGTALTAVLAAVLFAQPLTRPTILGIALVITGVLCIELGSQLAARKSEVLVE